MPLPRRIPQLLVTCVVAALALIAVPSALGAPLPGSAYDTGDGNQDSDDDGDLDSGEPATVSAADGRYDLAQIRPGVHTPVRRPATGRAPGRRRVAPPSPSRAAEARPSPSWACTRARRPRQPT